MSLIWLLIIGVIVIGLIAAWRIGKPNGDYDLLSPVVGWMIVVALMLFVLGVFFGYLMWGLKP